MALVALSARPAAADSPQVTVYEVDPPAHLTAGDHIAVSITVEADRGSHVQIAAGGIPPELAQAEAPKFSTKTLASGRIQVRIDLVLAAFVVGDYAMPPITLRVQDAGGSVTQLQTPAAHLTIESTVPANADGQPRPLKPQAGIGSPPGPPYELIAAALAVFTLAAAIMYVAWRRLNQAAPLPLAPAPAEVLGPEDAARRALDGAGARFVGDRDLAAYYAALSATVRGYLTARFGFPAFALTTAELQGQMVFRGMDRWQARLVAGLLEQCDAVTFARYRPAGERADADLTAAYEIVEMSRPPPQSEPEAVTA